MTKAKQLQQVDLKALAFEAAIGYHTPEEMCLKFGLTEPDLDYFQQSPAFQRAVALARRELDETGAEFRIKARRFASVVLADLMEIATDPDAAHSDRIAAIKEITRLAGYGREDAGQGNPNNAFQINIILGGQR